MESFAKLIQRIFGHFEVEPHWRRIEQRIRKIISMKFLKTGIRENLDPRNISAIRYIIYGLNLDRKNKIYNYIIYVTIKCILYIILNAI